MVTKIGKTKEETLVTESQEAREIVARILDFGVTQSQIIQIAYLLSLELENRNTMLDISQIIKKYINDLGEPKSPIVI